MTQAQPPDRPDEPPARPVFDVNYHVGKVAKEAPPPGPYPDSGWHFDRTHAALFIGVAVVSVFVFIASIVLSWNFGF